MNEKEIKFKVIIEKAFMLIERIGYENITISLLSKESGISRGWIYKYIGQDIQSVMRFCVETYAHGFVNTVELKEFHQKSEMEEAIYNFAEVVIKNFDAQAFNIIVYFKYLNASNEVGSIINGMNQKYVSHLAKNIQNITKLTFEESLTRAQIFHSMRMGGLQVFLGNGNREKLKEEYLKSLGTLITQALS